MLPVRLRELVTAFSPPGFISPADQVRRRDHELPVTLTAHDPCISLLMTWSVEAFVIRDFTTHYCITFWLVVGLMEAS